MHTSVNQCITELYICYTVVYNKLFSLCDVSDNIAIYRCVSCIQKPPAFS